MISVEKALERITANILPVEAETVPLLEADRRTLAEDVHALTTQPPFHASAMDGYAVRAADVLNIPSTLTVIGESAAGHGFAGRVEQGQAVRIFTGAPVPLGADAVVIQENTKRAGTELIVCSAPPEAGHLRRRGMDFAEGARLLNAGTRLCPRTITLAAAMGHNTLTVRRKPTVALIATGDELVLPGAIPSREQIVCSNPFGIAGIVARAGGQTNFLGIAQDDAAHLTELCKKARTADILITIGGASVGDHDIVAPVLQSMGMTLDFWRIAMRPGKPLMFGMLGKTRVVGLPGNPVSALVCSHIFIAPLIRAMLGNAESTQRQQTAILTESLEENGPRQHYMRAFSTHDTQGEHHVTPVHSQDSSLLSPLAKADVLIIRPPHDPELHAGARVNIMPLDF